MLPKLLLAFVLFLPIYAQPKPMDYQTFTAIQIQALKDKCAVQEEEITNLKRDLAAQDERQDKLDADITLAKGFGVGLGAILTVAQLVQYIKRRKIV
jgi:hypothetical protein